MCICCRIVVMWSIFDRVDRDCKAIETETDLYSSSLFLFHPWIFQRTFMCCGILAR